MKRLLFLLAILALGIGAYFLLRDDGVLEQVTEARVEAALLGNGVPADMAGCMAPRLTDRLSIVQLRRLERMAPQEGEPAIPPSTDAALERLRRVDDQQAVEQLVRVAAGCGVELMFGG
ncbi:hypothetical protein [Qipengyuania nanhaisediminis]|uniref:hypothetical protein n=1 Tax=Qipengyuania nanhaisediminis TaxID=604088 RepID=UPI0038B39DBF